MKFYDLMAVNLGRSQSLRACGVKSHWSSSDCGSQTAALSEASLPSSMGRRSKMQCDGKNHLIDGQQDGH